MQELASLSLILSLGILVGQVLMKCGPFLPPPLAPTSSSVWWGYLLLGSSPRSLPEASFSLLELGEGTGRQQGCVVLSAAVKFAWIMCVVQLHPRTHL